MSIDLNIKLQDEEANANKCDHDMENDDTSKSTTDDYQDMPEIFTPRTPQYTSPSLSDTNSDSDYSLSSCEDEDDTDEEFSKISEEEINEIQYLSIFDSRQEFDEEIMTTDDVSALKRWNL